MAGEVSEALSYDAALLLADTQLAALVSTHVYQGQVPQGIFKDTALYILGDYVSGADVFGVGGVRLMSDPLILWRVVAKGQLTASQRSADARMDAVLTNVRAQVSGDFQLSAVRERPFHRTTRDEAKNAYTEVGGYYRHYVSKQ